MKLVRFFLVSTVWDKVLTGVEKSVKMQKRRILGSNHFLGSYSFSSWGYTFIESNPRDSSALKFQLGGMCRYRDIVHRGGEVTLW